MQKQEKQTGQHICCSNLSLHLIKKTLSQEGFLEDFRKLLEIKKQQHQQQLQSNLYSYDLYNNQEQKQLETIEAKETESEQSKEVSHIIFAKKIYSMTNGQYDQYDANQYYGMALQGETILDIGKEKDIQAKYRSKNISSFKDKIILPGLFDTHNHYFYAFMNFKQFVDMSVKQGQEPQQAFNKIWNNLEYHLKKINQENKNRPFGKKKWVFARDYDKLRAFEGKLSLDSIKRSEKKLDIQNLNRLGNVSIQDDLYSNTPIFILEANTHIAHVNLAAFKQAKMDYKNPQNIPQPHGGTIVIDKQTNKLTGLLVQPPACSQFLKYSPKPQPLQVCSRISLLFENALKKGCTSMHDGGVGIFTEKPQEQYNIIVKMKEKLQVFQKIRLSILVTIDLWKLGCNDKSNPPYSKLNITNGDNLKKFRITGIKMWNDGSIQGGSGLLEKPYKLQDGLLWNSRRQPLSFETLSKNIRQAIKEGWPVAIHCNGDKAFSRAIKAICDVQDQLKDLSPSLPYRIHRIEHSTLVKEQDLEIISKRKNSRFTIHPSFLVNYLPKYGQVYKKILLDDKVAQTQMDLIGSSLKKGLEPSIHSDWMMTEINPLSFIESCVHRKMPNNEILNQKERVTVLEALKIVSLYAAKACYCEDIVGSLTPKKYADFIVLDMSPEQFESGQNLRYLSLNGVNQTWVNGKKVYPS